VKQRKITSGGVVVKRSRTTVLNSGTVYV